MKDLLSLSRMMNLYYHHLHNIANGPSFGPDHDLMAGFYEALDAVYDSLIERHMGLGGAMGKSELIDIIEQAHEALEEIPEGSDMQAHFQYALNLESLFRSEIGMAMAGASEGTKNMLQAFADESEVRSYNLGQRVK